MCHVRFKMSQNSLFAILLRSHWWISLLVAVAIVLFARIVVPEAYANYVFSFAIPFLVISVMAAWKQRHVPSAQRVQETVERVSAMNWTDFQALLEDAYRRQGGEVMRETGGADLRVTLAGRRSVVAARRWKAATHGLPALRELVEARERCEAREAIYVALSPLSDKGVLFARENAITVVDAAALAQLLQRGWLG